MKAIAIAIIEAISELTVGEFIAYIALVVGGIATVIEKTSKTVKPLTKLARAIGRAINSEVMDEVQQLKQEVQDMKAAEELRDIKAARTRVLRFGDELIDNVVHTKEHFDDVLRDITTYEQYCESHPRFENDQMTLTAEHIKDTYRKCFKDHSFK